MNIYEIHKSNPDIFTQISFKDNLFLYYDCPQKEQILTLYSNHNQLAFTISGKRIIHHGANTWISNENKGLLLKRCAYLQELPPDYSGWNVLVFYMKDEYLKKIFNELRGHLNFDNLPTTNVNIVEEFEINDKTRVCYHSILPYFEQPSQLPENIFESKFKELLFNILITPGNRNILSYISQISDGYITPIWEVMESNYMYNLSLAEFAQIANRSTSTFRREFEKYYHTTPGKWLTHRRLERAKSFLESGSKPIGEIAFECGFENVSHFSRLFKDHNNMSPLQFRNSKK
ncbi:MAG: helix-turn-helix transcriptional regulator [Marinifilaceae bacterium]|nr:helix-turn-helix transcriptional regulator [Marinifilaceae bacterium]